MLERMREKLMKQATRVVINDRKTRLPITSGPSEGVQFALEAVPKAALPLGEVWEEVDAPPSRPHLLTLFCAVFRDR